MTTPGPDGEGTSSELTPDSITDLLHTKEWLKNQLLQYKTELAAAQDETQILCNDPETILESMDKLQGDLQRATTDLMLKELLIKRVQQGSTMLGHIFPNSNGTGDATETSSEKKEQYRILMELVTKQTALVSEVLKTHKENQEISKEVDQLQKENLGLKQSVRELMDELQKTKESVDLRQKTDASNADISKARDELTKITERTELIRHIFQGLILGSGVNWAQDSALTELTLELGQNLDSLI